MRGRSYSYSPSPPRGYSRRGRSPSPRDRYGYRSRDAPTSLLVRNLHRDCRPEDLRGPFGHFGPLKDIYLPRDYYTGYKSNNKSMEDTNEVRGNTVQDFLLLVGERSWYENNEKRCKYRRISSQLGQARTRDPRGFGFVQFVYPADAADAKHYLDGEVLLGREIRVLFAEENRKKPSEMRARERFRGRSYEYRRSPPHYARSPRYTRTYSRSPDYYSVSPRRRHYSRSISPRDRRYRARSYSRSPYRSRSRSWSYSRSRSHSS